MKNNDSRILHGKVALVTGASRGLGREISLCLGRAGATVIVTDLLIEDLNNDPENAQKTRARFINPPKEIQAHAPAAITGMAQIGISGLAKVQYCVRSREKSKSMDDPYWLNADWKDATILPPPANWGGGLPGGKLPPTSQLDPIKGTPLQWPLRYTIAHWAALVPGLPAGDYELCCRTIDANGIAQPFPRTLPRTGFNALHIVAVQVKS